MKEVKIIVEGGVVQQVFVPEGVRVTVLDFDTDGVDEDRLIHTPDGDAVESIYNHEDDPFGSSVD